MVTWWHGRRWTNCTHVYRVQTLRPGRKLIWLYVPRLKKSAFTVVNCQDLKDEAERVIGCIIEVNIITEGKRQLGVVIWSKGYKSTTVMQKTWKIFDYRQRSWRILFGPFHDGQLNYISPLNKLHRGGEACLFIYLFFFSHFELVLIKEKELLKPRAATLCFS